MNAFGIKTTARIAEATAIVLLLAGSAVGMLGPHGENTGLLCGVLIGSGITAGVVAGMLYLIGILKLNEPPPEDRQRGDG